MATLLKHVNFSNVVVLGERDGVKVVLGERDRHGVKAPIVVKTYRTRTCATGKQLEFKYLHKAEVEARLLLHLHERVGDRADINIYCDEYLRSGLLYSSVSITMPACPTLLSIYDRMCVVGDKVLPNATTCVIGLELIKEVQHLHEKGLCHGDLHAGNVLVSKLAMVHRDARPCFRTLFANEEPDPPQPLEVRIIDFNMSFPFEKADSSPFNENGRTGKPGAMFLHDDIKAADRYTVVDDMGSVAVVLLFCSLGYNAISALSKEAKKQLQCARRDNNKQQHASAAKSICSQMDKFVRILLAEGVSSCDGDDEVIKELVPRVPEFLRRYMRVVQACRQKIVTSREIRQADIAGKIDYKVFSAVFDGELARLAAGAEQS